MNPGQQLHRSLTFWAGLITIAFTCFAWWDSYSHRSSITFRNTFAESSLHGLNFWRHVHSFHKWHTSRTHLDPTEPTLTWQRDLFPPPYLVHSQPIPAISPKYRSLKDVSMKAAAQSSASSIGPGVWTLFIPYWLILPPIILTWTTLLALRWMRLNRIPAPSSEPP